MQMTPRSNVIQDLLPLYADRICSGESRELVEEHIAECESCSVLLGQMRDMEMAHFRNTLLIKFHIYFVRYCSFSFARWLTVYF